MSFDPTEPFRRAKVAKINSDPKEREALEAKHGQVWDTKQLGADFIVEDFLAPDVYVRKKDTGEKGRLEFQHDPRYYYKFRPISG